MTRALTFAVFSKLKNKCWLWVEKTLKCYSLYIYYINHAYTTENIMFYQEENCSILTKSAVEYKLLSMWHNIPKKIW